MYTTHTRGVDARLKKTEIVLLGRGTHCSRQGQYTVEEEALVIIVQLFNILETEYTKKLQNFILAWFFLRKTSHILRALAYTFRER